MSKSLFKIFLPTVTKIDDQTFRVVLTTTVKDRQGQVVLSEGGQFQNFMSNPVILWAHQYLQPPIARAKTITAGAGSITSEFEFPVPGTYEFADTVRGLWGQGFINAVSVGIIPLEWKDDSTISKWELLEYSIVPIPANPESLRRMIQGASEIEPDDVEMKEGRILSAKNRTLITDVVQQLQTTMKVLKALLQAAEPAPKDELDNDADTEPDNDAKDKTRKAVQELREQLAKVKEAYQ